MTSRKAPGRWLTSVAMTAALALLASPAKAVDFGISVGAGLLGTSLSGTVGLTEKLNLRAGIFSPWSIDETATESDIEYDLSVELGGGAFGLLDWHPWGGGFRISAGIIQNNSEISGNARLEDSVEVGGTEYQPDDIGSLSAEMSFDSSAPYIGIGWGNAARGSGTFGFNIDFGVLLQGTPKAELRATPGPALPPAGATQLQNDVAEEEEELQDELDDLTILANLPVLQLGLRLTF